MPLFLPVPPASFGTPGPSSDPVVPPVPPTMPGQSAPAPASSPSPLTKSGLPRREVVGFYDALMVSPMFLAVAYANQAEYHRDRQYTVATDKDRCVWCK